jgi:hypothetical protein
MDRPIPLNKLRAILAQYGVSEDRKRGKGSHTMFLKQFEDGTYTYPVLTNSKDVLAVYVNGCRKKFRLLPSDGVTDEDFYS